MYFHQWQQWFTILFLINLFNKVWDSQQNVLNHLLNKIQFLRDRNHRGITNKICLIKLQFKTRSEKDSAKGSSRDNDDRPEKIDLTHKTSKENLFKVETDNTVD